MPQSRKESYPYLVRHNETGTVHVVELRTTLGISRDTTACGMYANALDASEASTPLGRAIRDHSLCRRCLASQTVMDFIVSHIDLPE